MDILEKDINNNGGSGEFSTGRNFSGIIDRDLAKQCKISSTTIRVLLNNTTGDAIFKDILSCWGIALSEEDEAMFRILLQSKLFEDTKHLCRQLDNLDLVKTLDSEDDTHITTSSTAAAAVGNGNHVGWKEESKVNTQLTARDAYDALMALFQQKDITKNLKSIGVTATQATPRTSTVANANAQLLVHYARHVQIIWSSLSTNKLFRYQKLHPERCALVPYYASEEVVRISSADFRPGPHDVSGANFPFPVITKLQLEDLIYEIHDIGGMSSTQRKRLAHYFGHVDVFIFAASLTQYDVPVMTADNPLDYTSINPTNRLAAALEEFRYFLQPKIAATSRAKRPIVILTNKESFLSKLNYTSVSDQPAFSEFDGTPLEAVNYFINKFKAVTTEGVLDVSENDQCRMQFFADSTRGVLMFEVSRFVVSCCCGCIPLTWFCRAVSESEKVGIPKHWRYGECNERCRL